MSRQREHDRRRRKAGWRRVDVWLDPETSVTLRNLSAVTGDSEQALVCSAVRQAAQSTQTPISRAVAGDAGSDGAREGWRVRGA